MTYTAGQIAAAARLVPEYIDDDWTAHGGTFCINRDNGHASAWQPWADTEAGRSDALVRLAAVYEWLERPDEYSGIRLKCKWEVATALNTGNVQQIQQATMAAAVAIGQHMEQSNDN